MNFELSFSHLDAVFVAAPLVVQIALAVTVFSIAMTLLTYLSIFLQRFKGYMLDRRKARLEPIIDDVIINQIILKEYSVKNEGHKNLHIDTRELQQSCFKGSRNKQVLINHLLHYRKNLRGVNGEMLKRIYLELYLDKESMRKLHSGKWHEKVRGLQEITTMEIIIPDVNILPLTNSKNREVRAAARSAYLKLSKNEAFKFFDVVTEPMLEWDQIELFRIITSSEDITIPNFAYWIAYSNNKTVVDFCMKLAVHYNQVSAADSIMKILDNRDILLRSHAINALGKLKIEEAEPRLMQMYNSQPIVCQNEILKALGLIETGKSYEFLKFQFLHANDFDIRKNAARSLVKSRNISNQMVEELKVLASPENLKILKHCMNPLIHY